MKISLRFLICGSCCVWWFLVTVALAIGLGVPVATREISDPRCHHFYDASENTTVFNALEDHVHASNTLSLPRSSAHDSCACVTGQPVFIAPLDLCMGGTVFGSSDTQFCGLYGRLQAVEDHVLVCASETIIDYMYLNQSSCHNPHTKLPFLHKGYLVCQKYHCDTDVASTAFNDAKADGRSRAAAEAASTAALTSCATVNSLSREEATAVATAAGTAASIAYSGAIAFNRTSTAAAAAAAAGGKTAASAASAAYRKALASNRSPTAAAAAAAAAGSAAASGA